MARVWLGLDVGDARIGCALSRSGIICEPVATVARRGRTQALDAIGRLVQEHAVTDIVLGLPLLEDGREGEQAEKTRAFSRSLARRMPNLRLHFEDERHTSGEAASFAGRAPAHGDIDSFAAMLILQRHLDSGAGKAQPE